MNRRGAQKLIVIGKTSFRWYNCVKYITFYRVSEANQFNTDRRSLKFWENNANQGE